MAATVQDSCVKILKSVRNCSLNYSCQETPYSIYLTIRKSWSKHHRPCEAQQIGRDQPLETNVNENWSLKVELAAVKAQLEASKEITIELGT